MAAIDPIAYLRATPPFDRLSPALFDEAAATAEIGYYPAGSRLATAGGAPLEHLYVIRRGAVRLERGGQVVQVLEEGEMFGYTSLITHQASLDVVVEEDVLAYRISRPAFETLLGDAQFSSHFAVGLAERLKSSLQHSPVATLRADLSTAVADLIRRPAVWIDANASAADAAEVMRDERISSVLIRGQPPGLVSDRELRNRVLAAGLGPDTPLSQVMRPHVPAVRADAPVHDAWAAMLDGDFRHIAVKRGDEIVAVLSSGDLLRATASGPVAVLRRVERLGRESLRDYGRLVAEMSASLLAAGLDVTAIQGFVARLNDALLRRALSWAEAKLGPSPTAYAWVVFGAEGRKEQTLLTDREHGLVHGEVDAAGDRWFAALAEEVERDVTDAGFPESAAGRTARHWRGAVSAWTRRIEDALDSHAHDSGVFFDLRRVAGSLDLSAIEAVLSAAHLRRHVVRMLAKASLGFRPPAAVAVRIRTSSVDLRRDGLLPVALLARCYAVELGLPAGSTLERLEAARGAGVISAETSDTIGNAFRFLVELRLRVHLRQIAAGTPPSDELSLSDVSHLERNRLKDALRAIAAWQTKSAYRYQIDLV